MAEWELADSSAGQELEEFVVAVRPSHPEVKRSLEAAVAAKSTSEQFPGFALLPQPELAVEAPEPVSFDRS